MKILILTILISFPNIFNTRSESFISHSDNFLLGNEVLIRDSTVLIADKRIGLVTNSSGVLMNGTLLLDLLSRKYSVAKVFTPEHGLRGNDINDNYIDEVTGIPVVTLYGSKKKPDPADLSDVDVIVYDIQDVGARFYTFINTMYYCMEAAKENGKKMIICDRPVMQNGNYTDGFMLNQNEKSFVGLIDIPISYAMTCGELAGYINSKYFGGGCNLTVCKMKGYDHSVNYESLHLPWIKPSPNIYFSSSAVCYLGTCLLEGTNFSEGRGSEKPFEYAGAPYCNGSALVQEMSAYSFPGVEFEQIRFTPLGNSNVSNPKFENENCEGIYIKVTDKNTFESVKTGIALLVSLKKLFPQFRINKNNFLDKLAGTDRLRLMLENGNSYDEIIKSYSEELGQFNTERKTFLLY